MVFLGLAPPGFDRVLAWYRAATVAALPLFVSVGPSGPESEFPMLAANTMMRREWFGSGMNITVWHRESKTSQTPYRSLQVSLRTGPAEWQNLEVLPSEIEDFYTEMACTDARAVKVGDSGLTVRFMKSDIVLERPVVKHNTMARIKLSRQVHTTLLAKLAKVRDYFRFGSEVFFNPDGSPATV